jgi:hypothetical protein
VHLGDTGLIADLRLRHGPRKAHQHQPLLTPGQISPVRPHGFHFDDLLDVRVVVTEEVTKPA